MSNTSAAKRLGRWFLINLVLASVICGLTGRYLDPWLWGFLATLALTSLYPALCLDADLAQERFIPRIRERTVSTFSLSGLWLWRSSWFPALMCGGRSARFQMVSGSSGSSGWRRR